MTVNFDEIASLCANTGMQVDISCNGTITLYVCMEADEKPDLTLSVVCEDAIVLKDTMVAAAAMLGGG